MADTSYAATRDYARSAFAVGSARRRSRSQPSGYVAGPSAPIAGAITPEGALAKAAHAIVAARANRDINDAMNRQAALEEARQAERDVMAREAFLDAHDPQRRLDRIRQETTAREQAQAAAKTPATRYPVPEDLKKFYPDAPDMTIDDIKAYRTIHGLDERGRSPKEERRVYVPYTGRDWPETSSVVSDYMGTKAGAPRKAGSRGRFDAIEEGERDAESRASQEYERVLREVRSELFANADEKTRSEMYAQSDAGAIPAAVLNDPRVKAAQQGLASTRGANVLRGLARAAQAGDFESISKALSRFYVGDPLKKDPRFGKARRAAVLKGIALARTRDDVTSLFDSTLDPDDPLNADREVTAALQKRIAELPE